MNYARMKGPGDFDPPEEEPSIWEVEGGRDYLEDKLFQCLGDPPARRDMAEAILDMLEGRYSPEATGKGLADLYRPSVENWTADFFADARDNDPLEGPSY